MSYPLGFVDFASSDPEGSARFFSEVLGGEVADGVHRRFDLGALPAGIADLEHGFEPVRKVLRPGDVVLYFEPDDLDAALEAVERSGGRVLLPPTESAPGHEVAIVVEPGGARIALTRIRQEARP